MSIYESGEMYLETIYILTKTLKNVRSIDVAEEMGYSKPSVSRAVGILKNAGYIIVDENGFLSLTEDGEILAKRTYERHNMLTDFFTLLGVKKETASEDACKIEHVISDETFNAIKKHISKILK
jgi:Mn-dependent DtxR family transcriptional regulator